MSECDEHTPHSMNDIPTKTKFICSCMVFYHFHSNKKKAHEYRIKQLIDSSYGKIFSELLYIYLFMSIKKTNNESNDYLNNACVPSIF